MRNKTLTLISLDLYFLICKMGIFTTPAVFVACICCKDCIYIMAVQELWEGIMFHNPLLFQVATLECRGQNRRVEKGMACGRNYDDEYSTPLFPR